MRLRKEVFHKDEIFTENECMNRIKAIISFNPDYNSDAKLCLLQFMERIESYIEFGVESTVHPDDCCDIDD